MFGPDKGLHKQLGYVIEALVSLVRETRQTNELLSKTLHSNEQLNSTLTSFLMHEDQRKMRAEAKEEEHARDHKPTKADMMY